MVLVGSEVTGIRPMNPSIRPTRRGITGSPSTVMVSSWTAAPAKASWGESSEKNTKTLRRPPCMTPGIVPLRLLTLAAASESKRWTLT